MAYRYVLAAVLATGSEEAAGHRFGLSHSSVKHHLAKARFKVGGPRRRRSWWSGYRRGRAESKNDE